MCHFQGSNVSFILIYLCQKNTRETSNIFVFTVTTLLVSKRKGNQFCVSALGSLVPAVVFNDLAPSYHPFRLMQTQLFCSIFHSHQPVLSFSFSKTTLSSQFYHFLLSKSCRIWRGEAMKKTL